MWARTLWPLLSSTRNIAFGRASTTVPSISITPSFFGMSSLLVAGCLVHRRPGNLPDPPNEHVARTGRVDLLQPLRAPLPGRAHASMIASRVVVRAAARHRVTDPGWADTPV